MTTDNAAQAVEQEPSDEAAAEQRRKNLLACDATFRKWFGDGFDLATSRVVLATAAAERVVGDPLWLLLVGGPGTAKTETLVTLDVVGAEIVSTINSEGALLAGTEASKDPVTGEADPEATGGLLRKLGPRGLLVIKDVTSILSMHHSSRAKVLAALREIYDGYWSRYIGSRGGRTLVWEGNIGLLGGVTTAWDTHHEVVSSMGDRFLLLRLNSEDMETRLAAGTQAMANNGKEGRMRAELRGAVQAVLSHFKPGHKIQLALPPDVESELLTIANLTTMARTAVEYDKQGRVFDAHAPEYPTRFAKQLGMLLKGGLAIGMTFGEALDLTMRVAQDSIPPMRRRVLQDVLRNPSTSAKEAADRLGKPYMSVQREMKALQALGMLLMVDGNPQRYTLVARWSPSVSSLFTRKVSTGGREGGDIGKAA